MESRSRFEQDYDRLVFSHPFRRLQDKTQVFPLPEDDFVHTRLTHSLEVSSVGRSLGRAVGDQLIQKYPQLAQTGITTYDFGGIVAAACLAHDLGNPPFGHSGETAISSFFENTSSGQAYQQRVSSAQWAELTRFEGNAQGFRILNGSGALRLTFATLGAFTKYPKTADAPRDKARRSQKKYGICQNNLTEYQQMAETMGLLVLGEATWCRHPLAFLVEAADDICYNIIDLEDGCRLGLVSFEQTRDLLAAIIGDRFQPEKLDTIADTNEKLGLLRALAISQLIQECVTLFIEKEEAMLMGSFDRALTDEIPSVKALDAISALSVEKIYRSKQVLEREAGGFEVIGKLMEAFTAAADASVFEKERSTPRHQSVFRLMPQPIQQRLKQQELSVYEMLQSVTDFISGLTDSHAIRLFRTIYGFSLPVSKG